MRVFFFFSSRRRHTRFDCDWSSDVCSSDLGKLGLVSAAAFTASKATIMRDATSAGRLNLAIMGPPPRALEWAFYRVLMPAHAVRLLETSPLAAATCQTIRK